MAWRRPTPAEPRFSVDVLVPPNSNATLTVPTMAAGHPDRITEGGRPIRGVTGVRLADVGGGSVRLELEAGSYRILSAAPP